MLALSFFLGKWSVVLGNCFVHTYDLTYCTLRILIFDLALASGFMSMIDYLHALQRECLG